MPSLFFLGPLTAFLPVSSHVSFLRSFSGVSISVDVELLLRSTKVPPPFPRPCCPISIPLFGFCCLTWTWGVGSNWILPNVWISIVEFVCECVVSKSCSVVTGDPTLLRNNVPDRARRMDSVKHRWVGWFCGHGDCLSPRLSTGRLGTTRSTSRPGLYTVPQGTIFIMEDYHVPDDL